MKCIDLNDGWQIEHRPLNAGLGARMYQPDYAIADDALAVTLPKTAQAALFEHGQLPDPNVGENSESYKWVEEEEWWYFRDFETPALEPGQSLELCFAGVTYRADVWVNGELAGKIEGMFREDVFDITGLLSESGTNRLAVRVRTQELARQDDRGSAIRGKVRNQGVVAQAMYRWNWCPHIVCVGVWRPVQLRVCDPVEIAAVRVRTVEIDLQNDDASIAQSAPARIAVEWDVTNTGAEPADVSVSYRTAGIGFDDPTGPSGTVAGRAEPGCTTTLRRELAFPDARLWWCNGVGDASRYELTSSLQSDGAAGEAVGTRFGVRTVAWQTNDEADWVTRVSGHSARPWTMIEPLYPWVLTLNGRRVFVKGSNWVHADILLRLDRERYENVLAPAKAAGFNFMRVWGGSLAETDEFYDTCDAMGIMCWQEFWLACENYPALDRDLLARCARDTVRRLINRPSLLFYSGGNEFEPDNLENKSAVDTLERVVAEEDPDRGFRRGSPYKGDKHGGLIPTPTGMRNKYLDILPGDKRQVLFRSEVAVGRSAPTFGNLRRFIDAQWPLDEAQFRHFFGVPSEFLGFAQEFAADDDFEKAVIANHLAHQRVLQVNLEYCRSQMFKCSGHLNWQYSVPWPCLHREIVDWWGTPKPAFYAYANGCERLALFLDVERYLWHPGETVRLPATLVNDGLPEEGITCTVQVWDVRGRLLHEQTADTSIGANRSMRIEPLVFDLSHDLAERSLILVSRIVRGGMVLFTNHYFVAVSNHAYADEALCLDGEWTHEDGSSLTLPGNDPSLGDDGFDSIVMKQSERDFEQAAEDRRDGTEAAAAVVYERLFTLPEMLKDVELEFFTPAIEGAYEIALNGKVLHRAPFNGSKLDLYNMAHVPAGGAEHSVRFDPDTDYKFFSDPITLAKLTPCFVDLPTEALDLHGENRLTIRLHSDCQKAISQSLYIRPRTTNRDAVCQFYRQGTLYRDLRAMQAADVSVQATSSSITLHNRSDVPAVALLLDVLARDEADGSDRVVATDQNLLTLLPGETATVAPLTAARFPVGSAVELRGWNVKGTHCVIEDSI